MLECSGEILSSLPLINLQLWGNIKNETGGVWTLNMALNLIQGSAEQFNINIQSGKWILHKKHKHDNVIYAVTQSNALKSAQTDTLR